MKALRFIGAFIILVAEIALMLPVAAFLAVAAGCVWVYDKFVYRRGPR